MFTNSNDIIIGRLAKEDQRDIERMIHQRSILKELNTDQKNTFLLDMLNRIGNFLISSGEKIKNYTERQMKKNTQTLVTS